MLHDEFPLLDLDDQRKELLDGLEGLVETVQELLALSDGGFPPDYDVFTENVSTLRAALHTLFPPKFQAAIDQEKADMSAIADIYEPPGY